VEGGLVDECPVAATLGVYDVDPALDTARIPTFFDMNVRRIVRDELSAQHPDRSAVRHLARAHMRDGEPELCLDR
jgi:hypothetical protein